LAPKSLQPSPLRAGTSGHFGHFSLIKSTHVCWFVNQFTTYAILLVSREPVHSKKPFLKERIVKVFRLRLGLFKG